MKTLKDWIVPSIIILAASAIVIFAFWPLENSDFAEGFRSGEVIESEGAEPEEPFGPEGRLTGFAALLPMIKVAAFMGIGVLFTAIGRGVARLIRRFRGGASPATQG